jgi:hypothetical protein
MTALTPLQQFVTKHYAGGEFAHLTNLGEAKDFGDTLLVFALYEASDAEDFDEFRRMLETAVDQLRSLIGEIP